MGTTLRTVAIGGLAALMITACGGGGFSESSSSDSGTALPPPAVAEPYADVFFENPGVNPFVVTAEDPLSTFAVDVDTGSYTIARQYLNDGHRPEKDSVRIEEYVNYFDQGYADPESGPFSVVVDGGTTPYVQNPQTNRIVRIGVQSRHIVDAERRPAALTFVVDTSGSMGSDGRLELVKRSLEVLVAGLEQSDTVALVTYGDSADLVLGPTPVSDARTILAAIAGLEAGGSTNAEAGLVLGYEQARAGFRPGDINRVVLASDGVANVGATGPESILASIGEEAADGINLVTVGVGMGNYNDTMMEQLANQGDGFYAYVDDQKEAERIFSDELTSTLQTLAEETKIQVDFDPNLVESYRLIGFENRAIDDNAFRDEQLPGPNDAGEVGAGHDVTALYELTLRPQAPASQLGAVTLRWTDPDSKAASEMVQPIMSDQLAAEFSDAPERFQLAVVVAAWGELLRESPYLMRSDNTYDELAERAETLAASLEDEDVAEFADLVTKSATLD